MEALRVALRDLAESDRELISLIAWDELTPSQAAQVLGISPVSARVRLHRARARLRKKLDDEVRHLDEATTRMSTTADSPVHLKEAR